VQGGAVTEVPRTVHAGRRVERQGGAMSLNVKVADLAAMPSPADVIFEALREAIVEGALQDGETLRQDRIAGMFNVSRIPVREALARLEEHGLVTTRRHKGAVVSSLSLDEITELFEFRALVEGELIRRSVERIRPETLEEATRFADEFARETDSARWAPLNRRFHYTLYKDSQRPFHLQIVSGMLDKVGRYLRAQLILTDGIDRARREHDGILRAALARDPDETAYLTRAHILGASRSLLKFLRDQRG
jgi:DNA-binding GntR family transcriptional regulator